MPSRSPGKISVSWNNNGILVTWQLLTLVEARGFIEYIISFKILMSSDVSSVRVPMNQSSITLTGLDSNQAYEITVGTATLSNGMLGPVSTGIVVTDSHNSSRVTNSTNVVAISASVAGVLVAILIVATTIFFACLLYRKVRKSRYVASYILPFPLHKCHSSNLEVCSCNLM